MVLIILYIGSIYMIFSGEMQEIITNIPAGDDGIGGAGTNQPVGIGDSIIVVITRAVQYDTYWGVIPVPIKKGNLDLSTYHFYFFNVIVPFLIFAIIAWNIWKYIRNQRKEREAIWNENSNQNNGGIKNGDKMV